MDKVKRRDETLVALRVEIIKAMKSLQGYVSSEDIQKQMGDSYNTEQIGNNLRILKDMGVTANTKIEGKYHWTLTGEEFVAQAPVGILIKFPKAVHEGLTRVAKSLGLSKNNFVVKSVAEYIDKAK